MQKLDKIFSKNRHTVFNALKGQLSRKTQSKDLVENLNDEEKARLQLFGKYSLLILKKKHILADFRDPNDPTLQKKKYKL